MDQFCVESASMDDLDKVIKSIINWLATLWHHSFSPLPSFYSCWLETAADAAGREEGQVGVSLKSTRYG